MPLYSQKKINNGIVALWKITETKEELIDLLPKSWLSNLDLNKVSQHNLAARVLANLVCPNFDLLEKDEYGKPYFDSADHFISITHSGDYAGFMYNDKKECGIDMEKITGRVERIVSKFIREDEGKYLQLGLNGMYTVWCAKEAMYKYYGLKSLDFKKHLKLDYQKLEQHGSLSGHIDKGTFQQSMELEYEFIDEYLLVYTN